MSEKITEEFLKYKRVIASLLSKIRPAATRQDIEDILQDTFVKLWNNCDNVNYNKVKSYLFTVATNLFLNIKKHEKDIIYCLYRLS